MLVRECASVAACGYTGKTSVWSGDLRLLCLILGLVVGCAGDSEEICGNGADEDGDGAADCADADCASTCDVDGDGYLAQEYNGADCDDSNPSVNPGAVEVCNEGVDDDCNGVADDSDPGVDPSTQAPWYTDGDGDGWGLATSWVDACSQPEGTSADNGDCDDRDELIFPGSVEVCGGSDEDCDGFEDDEDDDTDPSTMTSWHPDVDGDEFGDELVEVIACAAPPDHIADGTDCDDDEATTHPGADEVCDDEDDDCDGDIDEDPLFVTWYADVDGDGFGDPDEPLLDCRNLTGQGWVLNDGDCNDQDEDISPAASEVCDGMVDNDCNDLADEDDPGVDLATRVSFYDDDDGDGFGDPDESTLRCNPLPGTVADSTDCDDSTEQIHPDAPELCNGFDDNCDETVDDDDPLFDPADYLTFWFDGDGDGYGDDAQPASACEIPPDHIDVPGDCDDTRDDVHPGHDELCDEADNDCNTLVDDDYVIFTWYLDFDGDSYGDPEVSVDDCEDLAPLYRLNDADCDDDDEFVNPGAPEVCNEIDDDCDDLVDDEDDTVDPADFFAWFEDLDGDGAGNAVVEVAACEQPDGFVAEAGDCDDDDELRSPLLPEVCDGFDNDCDELVDGADDDVDPDTFEDWYADLDLDGFGAASELTHACDAPPFPAALVAGDCNDADGQIHPGATEVCNRADDDCDGAVDEADADLDVASLMPWYADADDDGYGDPTASELACEAPAGLVGNADDCDDADEHAYPGAVERCDGVDQDCDSIPDNGAVAVDWWPDADGDGWGDFTGVAISDCADLWATHSTLAGDCADDDPDLHPSAVEVCDGIDNNCDLIVDRPIAGDAVTVADADASFWGEAAGDRAGASVAAAGDVDGDGIADLILGAVEESTGGTWAGAAYVVFGPVTSSAGLSTVGAKLVGESAWDRAGQAVAGVGDQNLDGFDDVVVGAPEADGGGVAYLVSGPVLGELDLAAADARIGAVADGDELGAAVAPAGDVNGDGWPDLVVGAAGHDAGRGAVYLFLGPLAGHRSAADADATLLGVSTGDAAGSSVSAAGDLNRDGFDDLIVGAPGVDLTGDGAGAAYIVLGPVEGTVSLESASAVVVGEAAGDHAGATVAGLGDLDGDGFGDLLVGAPDSDAGALDAGAAYIVYGPPAAVVDLVAAERFTSSEAFGYAGLALGSGGDGDGDGIGDWIVGGPFVSSTAGAAHVVRGGDAVGPGGFDALALASVAGAVSGDNAGSSVAIGGDLDGDGLDDVVLGAWGDDGGGADAGVVHFFRGCPVVR